MVVLGGRRRPRPAVSSTDRQMAAAYDATGHRWCDGPGAVYGRLAEMLVARSPVAVPGAGVIDIGAGTGAASSAARRAGANRIVAVDIAIGMLAVGADRRPPAAVAHATRLPFGAGAFDLALAAFSFNHLDDAAAGFAEAARVVRRGGAVLASAYASDDTHPVKAAVESVLRAHGWSPEPWQAVMQTARAPQLATEESCRDVVARAGLTAAVERVRVAFPELGPRRIVEWRLGMAQHARFVAALPRGDRGRVVDEVLELLANCPPLVRSVMVITATV